MKLTNLLAAAAVAAVAVPAQAELLTFTLTGDFSTTFSIDSNPVPDFSGTSYFALYDLGSDVTDTGLADYRFYDSTAGGGFTITDYFGDLGLFFSADGPQLFTGGTTNPVFTTGTFALTETGGTGSYTLTIASATAAVPEPAAWALMIGGFGLAGTALRRTRRTTVAYAAA